MIPHITRGGDTRGLIGYLVGPGIANEHANQHVVSGSFDLVGWVETHDIHSAEAIRDMAAGIDAYMTDLDVVRPKGTYLKVDMRTGEKTRMVDASNHVWHCSLSLSPKEPAQSDERWAQIATEFMTEMGFETPTDPTRQCQWIAIRHGFSKNGGDHIHIAANIIRANGDEWNEWNDRYRAQRTCNLLEHKFGLKIVESREANRAAQWSSHKDHAKAEMRSDKLTDTQRIEVGLRAAAASSDNEVQFLAQSRSLGIRLRPWYGQGSTEKVVGYLASLDGTKWVSAPRIASDLQLERLRDGWTRSHDIDTKASESWKLSWGRHTATNGAPLDAFWNDTPPSEHDVKVWFAHADRTDPDAVASYTHHCANIFAAAQVGVGREGPAADVFAQASRQVGIGAQTKWRPRPQAMPGGMYLMARSLVGSMRPGKTRAQAAQVVYALAAYAEEVIALYEDIAQYNTAARMREACQGVFTMRTEFEQILPRPSYTPDYDRNKAPEISRETPATTTAVMERPSREEYQHATPESAPANGHDEPRDIPYVGPNHIEFDHDYDVEEERPLTDLEVYEASIGMRMSLAQSHDMVDKARRETTITPTRDYAQIRHKWDNLPTDMQVYTQHTTHEGKNHHQAHELIDQLRHDNQVRPSMEYARLRGSYDTKIALYQDAIMTRRVDHYGPEHAQWIEAARRRLAQEDVTIPTSPVSEEPSPARHHEDTATFTPRATTSPWSAPMSPAERESMTNAIGENLWWISGRQGEASTYAQQVAEANLGDEDLRNAHAATQMQAWQAIHSPSAASHARIRQATGDYGVFVEDEAAHDYTEDEHLSHEAGYEH